MAQETTTPFKGFGRPFLIASILGVMISPVDAGVTVIENVSPGASSWPGNPLISTLLNPAAQATVGESFNSVGGCTNYSETFTVTGANYMLQGISLYAGAGTGTGSGTNLTLRLFDLGSQSAPNPSPYSPGADKFSSGNGLAVSYSPQSVGVLQFSFTGSDQMTLTNGHLYAFEIDGAANASPLAWWRAISDTYSGGAAYRDRAWINGNNARDFAMAVYATLATNSGAGSNTNSLPMPFGIVDHAFAAAGQDGANPAAGLVLANGSIYGTTLNGAAQGAGSLFRLAPDGSAFATQRAFAGAPDSASPQSDLIAATGGFFGATAGGGTNGAGTVFFAGTNGTFSIIRHFASLSPDNETNFGGASPGTRLVLAGSTLYGTTTSGGAAANGTVFTLATNGAFTVLHDFSPLDCGAGTNADGAVPCGGLVQSGNELFGTTSAGGSGGSGTIFSMNTDGSGLVTLHDFSPLDPVSGTNADGAMPVSALVYSNQTLYGTTITGGDGGQGTVFAIGTNGQDFVVLHHFSATDPYTATNSDGAAPPAGLVLSGGCLYGTASAGGVAANGTVFSLSTAGAPFQVLHSFSARDPAADTNVDGAVPVASLLSVGRLVFGSTFTGGPGGAGTVFSVALPAVITGAAASNGTMTISFLSAPRSTNIVQAAGELAPFPAWLNVSTNVADTNGGWQFAETIDTNTARFYRSYAP